MLVILLLTVLGCNGNDKTKNQAKPPEPLAAIAGEWGGHNGDETLKLWLAKSGPFVAIASVDTKQHTAKGNAALQGDKLVLTPTEFDGAPAVKEEDKKPATLTLSADGKSLTSEDGVVLSKR